MEKLQTLKGFRDILDSEMIMFRRIEDVARKHLLTLGYREIEVPVLEKTELFIRSIGDATDIVEKEMFTFTDLGGDSVTLRPEATAGVVRAYLQSGMYARERLSKVFTAGPMFRHEKPQKGRFREFHQIDVEVFGTDDPLIDAELVWMITLILQELSVANFAVEVNSVGCRECREEFRTVLVDYFESKKDHLCGDCLRRLLRNPLRIFDCKVAGCIDVSHESPLLYEHLCTGCMNDFKGFLSHLEAFGVTATVNKRLVRGLDYYTKTVFEITSQDLGAQKACAAGGRYNNLVEEMGGPHTPGSGFAIGVERLALISDSPELSAVPKYFFAYLGDQARDYIVPFVRFFAARSLTLHFAYDGKSLKAQMRYADGLGAKFVLILGDDEISRGVIVVRNMETKEQKETPLDLGRLDEVLEVW